jgi:hypothetical protein
MATLIDPPFAVLEPELSSDPPPQPTATAPTTTTTSVADHLRRTMPVIGLSLSSGFEPSLRRTYTLDNVGCQLQTGEIQH